MRKIISFCIRKQSNGIFACLKIFYSNKNAICENGVKHSDYLFSKLAPLRWQKLSKTLRRSIWFKGIIKKSKSSGVLLGATQRLDNCSKIKSDFLILRHYTINLLNKNRKSVMMIHLILVSLKAFADYDTYTGDFLLRQISMIARWISALDVRVCMSRGRVAWKKMIQEFFVWEYYHKINFHWKNK